MKIKAGVWLSLSQFEKMALLKRQKAACAGTQTA